MDMDTKPLAGDESQEKRNVEQSEMVFANIKRTYDAYQDLDLQHARTVQQLTAQALQNAIETANMVSKQAVRHSDLAIDRQWNLEVSEGAAQAVVMRSVTLDDAALKSIGASLAAAVADALKTQ